MLKPCLSSVGLLLGTSDMYLSVLVDWRWSMKGTGDGVESDVERDCLDQALFSLWLPSNMGLVTGKAVDHKADKLIQLFHTQKNYSNPCQQQSYINSNTFKSL